MIVFDRLWIVMQEKGVSEYWLSEKSGISRQTIKRLKAHENVKITTLAKLCIALNCQLEDIMEYIPDNDSNNNLTEK